MRNRRVILVLLLLIGLLAALEAFLGRGSQRMRALARSVLCENAADSTSLVLARRGEPQTVLARDGVWRLRQPFAAVAEEPVVLKLLDSLARAPVEESISEVELLRLGRTRADFALEEPPLRVTLSNDAACVSLSFGLLTPSGDGVYAAVDGERSVLIVPSSVLAAVDLPVDRLRRRRLFGYGEDAVASFDIKQGPGVILSFARDGAGWRLGTETAASAVVTRFLKDLTSLAAQTFVWPTGATNESAQASASLLAGYGLDPETAVTVTLKRSGGRNASLSFGNRAGEKAVYALIHSGGAIVTVPSAAKDAALQDLARFSDTRLFRMEAEKVSAFSLSDGDMSLSVSRVGTSSWRLDAPIAAPADSAAVEALLSRVLALSSADLDSSGLQVSLGGAASPQAVSRAAVFPDGGGFERFRAKEIVDFRGETVKRLVSTDGTADARGVSVVFACDRRAWNVERAPEGAVASTDGIARVLDALMPLTALRVERLRAATADWTRYGLERPVLRLAVDLERENAVRRNILVGAETPEGGRYATVGAADAVFVVSDEAFKALASPLTKTNKERQEVGQ